MTRAEFIRRQLRFLNRIDEERAEAYRPVAPFQTYEIRHQPLGVSEAASAFLRDRPGSILVAAEHIPAGAFVALELGVETQREQALRNLEVVRRLVRKDGGWNDNLRKLADGWLDIVLREGGR